MKGKIRNTYQLMTYLQAQRVLYLLKVLEYIKALKTSCYQEACSITDDNLTIRYTINPAEYKAFSAYVALLEEDEIINIIPSEKTGAGTATFAEGFQFKLNKKYEVQIILNYGTRVEIRSEKAELKVVRMAVVNQLGQEIAIDEIVQGNVKKVEELRYSDGTNTTKRYRIKLELGRLFGKIPCSDIQAKAAVMKKDGNNITIPEGEEYPKSSVDLAFGEASNVCLSKVDDTLSAFALTNLSMEALGDAKNEILPLYGGIGNKFRIEFTIGLTGAKKDIRIEPVGVIIIGIDGLRQDVLYPDTLDKVQEQGKYRIGISSLIGLRQILAGYDQTDENKQRYKMLPEVTAVFPSITLASWASIFTGMMPGTTLDKDGKNIGYTGMLGNEFFARDIYKSNTTIPGMENLPRGMITLSDGAFYNGSIRFYANNLLPAHDYSPTTGNKLLNSSPNQALMSAQTIYQWIAGNVRNYENPEACGNGGDCRSVVFFNHYARGADWWGTVDLVWWQTLGIKLGVEEFFRAFISPVTASETLDKTPTKEALGFLSKYYPEDDSQIGGYKMDRRFPALFTVYYGGPDHYAHDIGMNAGAGGYSGYKDYFQRKTDAEIKQVVDQLKLFDEFNNKIFIITADHGMTEMATDLTYKDKNWLGIEVDKPADTSCKLNLEFADPENPEQITSAQKAEKANNNLHIWEMGEVLKLVGKETGLNYKVLSPKPIAKLFVDEKGNELPYGATSDINKANVITAMNGPMAHIYLKSNDGWQVAPDATELGYLALALKRIFQEGGINLDEDFMIKTENKFARLLSSIDAILIRSSLNNEYEVYAGDLSNTAKYINAINRIKGMNNPDRSGDIILIMKSETDSSATDRYSTGVSCKSWHGSLNRSDSYVPMIVAYPGGNKKEIEDILQQETLCKADYSDCRGNWKLTDIVKEIIKNQFSNK